MKFFSLALLATAAAASPAHRYFHLISSGASNSTYNGLYLSTQSTGPLNSQAILTSEESIAGVFIMNNGTVRYKAENNAPWELALIPGKQIKSGVEVSVSPKSGSTGFSLSKGGILQDSSTNFSGWLACSDKGLYYVNAAVGSGTPDGCYDIKLKADYEFST
ncbi:hypothetical protein N7495_006962 [Penicillium taxi]|uniref:uncharacterized protein n=1 Tax=Penicillium taxi TaxID=168475 RepID=UPI0025457669|nr:uncharacterized protein N7495_006962 [Penicillium taxi]KAJ5895271.1 hypothetical protein N7495_006962 [Penicillium taxi]